MTRRGTQAPNLGGRDVNPQARQPCAPHAREYPGKAGPASGEDGRLHQDCVLRCSAVRQSIHVRQGDRDGVSRDQHQTTNQSEHGRRNRSDGRLLSDNVQKTDLDEDEIPNTYCKLQRAEKSFRIAKTGRPRVTPVVGVDARALTHFLTYYLGLLVIRLFRQTQPSHPSAQAPLTEMHAIEYSYVDYSGCSTTTELI